jgi:restriction system protein
MSRRNTLIAALNQTAKALDKAQRQHVREAEQAQQAYLRAQEQARRVNEQERKQAEKERARLYIESRVAQVASDNRELEDQIKSLENLLNLTLQIDDYVNLDKLKVVPDVPLLKLPIHLRQALPTPSVKDFFPPELSAAQKLLPWVRSKHEEQVQKAKENYDRALAEAEKAAAARQERINTLKREHDEETRKIVEEAEVRNKELDELKKDLAESKPNAIVEYIAVVLSLSKYPEGFPKKCKLAYIPESRQLVMEYDLPTLEVVPNVTTYKYNKTADEITSTARPVKQRNALYASIIAQVTLRSIHEVFEADRHKNIDSVVFNGYVEMLDKSTGRMARTCLITVRTTRESFLEIDLGKVDPELCLKGLSASISKSPAELAPVRPVIEFKMVDSRFIEETDVLSTLDQRPNLMVLSPTEFEALISNLFQEMGLETRLTQASRDGGVDCVAYDPRPILGGKVVIQAKRYKNTVDVSAVRDLYGTMQNEGASKGILVTTSGYGKAAFEFAEGKPLELLSGSNLLYLLKEHAGIEAKIVMPDP